MPLRFNMLLVDEGIDPSEVRLLRHQTGQSGRSPYSLWRDDVAAFESYQSVQNAAQRARFSSRYWASFVVPPSAATLFVGMFEVNLIGPIRDGTIDPLRGETLESRRPVEFYDQYRCQRVQALSEYIGRLSVHWGDLSSASRAWVQRADKQDRGLSS